jgi:hypothetical protein
LKVARRTNWNWGSLILPRRHGALLEGPALELPTHQIARLAGEHAVDDAAEARRALEILAVHLEDDLLPPLPSHEPERSGADGAAPEGVAQLLDGVPRDDLGVSHREQRHEGRVGLGQAHLDGVTVERAQARHARGAAVAKLPGPLDPAEEIGGPGLDLGIEQASEGEHDIGRFELAAVVELDTLPQGEGPDEPVPGRPPVAGQGRRDRQRLIELDEAVEDLLRHRSPVDVADARGVEGGGVVAERAPVHRRVARLLRVDGARREPGGEQDGADDKRGAEAPPCHHQGQRLVASAAPVSVADRDEDLRGFRGAGLDHRRDQQEGREKRQDGQELRHRCSSMR